VQHPGAPASRREIVTAALGGWILAGAGLDAWWHVSSPDLETFLTPAHAVLYSGFAVTSWWMVREWRVARTAGLASVHVPSVVGLGLFAVGGVGDLIWHSTFGVERQIGAVASPSHIVLMAGAALVLSAPLRTAWNRAIAGWRQMIAPFLSAVSLVALASLVFSFLSPFVRAGAGGTLETQRYWIGEMPYDVQRTFVASVLVSNVILFGSLLALVRRWRVPRLFTFGLVLVPTVVVMAVGSFRPPEMIAVAVCGAGLVELLHAWLRPSEDRRRYHLFGFAGPMAFWVSYVALVPTLVGEGWDAELASGAVNWSALSGLGVAAVLWRDSPARSA